MLAHVYVLEFNREERVVQLLLPLRLFLGIFCPRVRESMPLDQFSRKRWFLFTSAFATSRIDGRLAASLALFARALEVVLRRTQFAVRVMTTGRLKPVTT